MASPASTAPNGIYLSMRKAPGSWVPRSNHREKALAVQRRMTRGHSWWLLILAKSDFFHAWKPVKVAYARVSKHEASGFLCQGAFQQGCDALVARRVSANTALELTYSEANGSSLEQCTAGFPSSVGAGDPHPNGRCRRQMLSHGQDRGTVMTGVPIP